MALDLRGCYEEDQAFHGVGTEGLGKGMHSEAESNEADAKPMLMTFSLTQTPNGLSEAKNNLSSAVEDIQTLTFRDRDLTLLTILTRTQAHRRMHNYEYYN